MLDCCSLEPFSSQYWKNFGAAWSSRKYCVLIRQLQKAHAGIAPRSLIEIKITDRSVERCAELILNHAYGAAREPSTFRERYQRTLALGRDAPAQQPNSAFTNNYVLLVYGKAVLFFQAMRQQIGDVAFDRFLHDYYAANRYRYVTGADLVRAANQACSCDVQPLYDDWITRAVPLSAP